MPFETCAEPAPVFEHHLRALVGRLDPSGDPASWLDRQIIDISEKKIAKVTLTQPDGTKLIISRPAPEAKFAAEDAPADAKFKSEATTSGPSTALETFDLDDVKSAAELPVPDKDVVSASFTTFDGLTVDLRLIERDKTDWVAIAATGSGSAEAEAKKIEDKVSHWTYAIPGREQGAGIHSAMGTGLRRCSEILNQ